MIFSPVSTLSLQKEKGMKKKKKILKKRQGSWEILD